MVTYATDSGKLSKKISWQKITDLGSSFALILFIRWHDERLFLEKRNIFFSININTEYWHTEQTTNRHMKKQQQQHRE